ncbi:MAG: hypothetical protein IKP65_04415 [Alphaproteobacteria bacterium]|nr:hypothetical protein [Alphaproteobacteria bacterium]
MQPGQPGQQAVAQQQPNVSQVAIRRTQNAVTGQVDNTPAGFTKATASMMEQARQQQGNLSEDGNAGGQANAPVAKVEISLKLTGGLEKFIESMAPKIVQIGMNKNGGAAPQNNTSAT